MVESVSGDGYERISGELAYVSRLLTEFNKYETLEMLETLHIRSRTPNVTSVLPDRLLNGQGEGQDLQEPI